MKSIDNILILKKIEGKATIKLECYECKRTIEINEMCVTEAGHRHGELFCFNTCFDCSSVKKTFFNHFYDYGRLWDIVKQVIYFLGDIPEDCIANLPSQSRGKVCDIIEETLKFSY